ncbi:MAG: MBL fold metallo-hydrolase [Bacillota bacterium]
MELIQLREDVFLLRGGTNAGVVRTQSGEVMLVDSGLDASVGRRISKQLKSAGLKLGWIVTTHSHADHIGANRFLQEEHDCEILASPLEAPWIENSSLEALALFGYAEPPRAMMTKFLLAEQSKVSGYAFPPQLEVGGTVVTVLDLAGHSPGQVGILYNGVLFCGDAVFGPQVIQKHPVVFHSSVSRALATLESLKKLSDNLIVVPGHGSFFGPGSYPFKKVVDINIAALRRVQQLVLECVQLKAPTAAPTEEIFSQVCRAFSCWPHGLGEYCLMRTAVCAHLSHLEQLDVLEAVISDHGLCWKLRNSVSQRQ